LGLWPQDPDLKTLPSKPWPPGCMYLRMYICTYGFLDGQNIPFIVWDIIPLEPLPKKERSSTFYQLTIDFVFNEMKKKYLSH
jgi:hypothetical protein